MSKYFIVSDKMQNFYKNIIDRLSHLSIRNEFVSFHATLE